MYVLTSILFVFFLSLSLTCSPPLLLACFPFSSSCVIFVVGGAPKRPNSLFLSRSPFGARKQCRAAAAPEQFSVAESLRRRGMSRMHCSVDYVWIQVKRIMVIMVMEHR